MVAPVEKGLALAGKTRPAGETVMDAGPVKQRAAAAAVAAVEERLARICGNVNPSADNPPACKKVRRAIGLEAFHRDCIINAASAKSPDLAQQRLASVPLSFLRPIQLHARPSTT